MCEKLYWKKISHKLSPLMFIHYDAQFLSLFMFVSKRKKDDVLFMYLARHEA